MGAHFLIGGLPDDCAAGLAQSLRSAGAAVDVSRHLSLGHQLLRDNCHDVLLVALRACRTVDLAELAFWRRQNTWAGILAVIPARDVRQIAQVFDSGADDCVTMPFDLEEARARLHALARRVDRFRPETSIIRTHDLEIDLASRTVRRGGRVILLTAREYALLQLLALRPGEVVGRKQICERIYGGLHKRSSNVVKVHIAHLRDKIDRGFDLPLILTRWGIGYLLRAEDAPAAAHASPCREPQQVA